MFEEIKQHNALVRDQIFKGIVDVKWNSHSFAGGKYDFSVDGKDVQGYKVYAADRNMGYGNFCRLR